MKRFKLFAALAGILGFALLILNPFSESTGPEAPGDALVAPVASEGTPENPHARREHEWLLLRNPATGEIPKDIGRQELAFARRLAEQSDLQSISANEDWVSRGPYNVGGRTRAVAIDVTNG